LIPVCVSGSYLFERPSARWEASSQLKHKEFKPLRSNIRSTIPFF
jgi:hypothetical protein